MLTHSPSHRQTGTPVINIQSTLCTAPDLRKNVSLAVLCSSNGNSYIVSLQASARTHTHTHTHTHIYIYIYIYISIPDYVIGNFH